MHLRKWWAGEEENILNIWGGKTIMARFCYVLSDAIKVTTVLLEHTSNPIHYLFLRVKFSKCKTANHPQYVHGTSDIRSQIRIHYY